MKVLVDASLLLAAFLPEEDCELFESLADEAEAGRVELITAPHCFLEVGTGLLRAVRRSRLSEEMGREAWVTLGALPLSVEPFPGRDRVFNLAVAEQLSLYDAAYLAIASDLGALLATADRALASAAMRQGLLWRRQRN